MRGVFVGTNGTIEVREYELPIHKSVGVDVLGYVERVKPRGLPREYMFLCNEEGLISRLPRNKIATKLYQHEHIAGDVVILKEGMTREGINCINMTEEDARQMVELLKQIKLEEEK